MSETKHTPLPWRACKGTLPHVIMGGNDVVCECYGSVGQPKLSNTALIIKAVNSYNPKRDWLVEQLLKSIRESDRIYDHVRAAARKVEAALKVSP